MPNGFIPSLSRYGLPISQHNHSALEVNARQRRNKRSYEGPSRDKTPKKPQPAIIPTMDLTLSSDEEGQQPLPAKSPQPQTSPQVAGNPPSTSNTPSIFGPHTFTPALASQPPAARSPSPSIFRSPSVTPAPALPVTADRSKPLPSSPRLTQPSEKKSNTDLNEHTIISSGPTGRRQGTISFPERKRIPVADHLEQGLLDQITSSVPELWADRHASHSQRRTKVAKPSATDISSQRAAAKGKASLDPRKSHNRPSKNAPQRSKPKAQKDRSLKSFTKVANDVNKRNERVFTQQARSPSPRPREETPVLSELDENLEEQIIRTTAGAPPSTHKPRPRAFAALRPPSPAVSFLDIARGPGTSRPLHTFRYRVSIHTGSHEIPEVITCDDDIEELSRHWSNGAHANRFLEEHMVAKVGGMENVKEKWTTQVDWEKLLMVKITTTDGVKLVGWVNRDLTESKAGSDKGRRLPKLRHWILRVQLHRHREEISAKTGDDSERQSMERKAPISTLLDETDTESDADSDSDDAVGSDGEITLGMPTPNFGRIEVDDIQTITFTDRELANSQAGSLFLQHTRVKRELAGALDDYWWATHVKPVHQEAENAIQESDGDGLYRVDFDTGNMRSRLGYDRIMVNVTEQEDVIGPKQ
ncbi:hypothetical protein F5Y15DRAFT_389044 [Xylariaceae sp. FL0016]|nr:hypothetical protein F5Y15DRAFT_389044 [Xylariaceae sp. FL0016]